MIVINGSFLCRNLTGIERFAYEVCKRLDHLVARGTVQMLVPANAVHVPAYTAIEVVRSPHSCKVFPIWDHGWFSWYAQCHDFVTLDFDNVTPLFHPGVVFIHDIYAAVHPEDFTSRRDKLIRRYACLMYRHAARHAKQLITVSEFSRQEIAETYRIDPDRIAVVPNGWDHFRSIEADDSIFGRLPALRGKPYFFTLGSLSKRKNLRWIATYAQAHQDQCFVISGKAISGLVPDELKCLQTLPNVLLAGYLSDGEVKALMQHCKAFVFPSYYEGFGIPPLEALSCGAPIIISRAASLPGIYGRTAHYINPYDTSVDLDDLLKEPVEDPRQVLESYTYDHAAEKLATLLRPFERVRA